MGAPVWTPRAHQPKRKRAIQPRCRATIHLRTTLAIQDSPENRPLAAPSLALRLVAHTRSSKIRMTRGTSIPHPPPTATLARGR
jgi:hypothetical protein